MSSDTISLELNLRTEHGKKLNSLRQSGMVPAVIFERGKESISVKAPYITMMKVYKQAGKHHAVELNVEGKKHLAMIQAADLEPVKRTLRHLSFHAVNRNETVEAEVAIHFDGQAPAERLGLMVIHPIDHLEIEALPGDLLNEILVDASVLNEEGDKITVADLIIPANVKVLTEPDRIVAVVEAPRSAVEAEAQLTEESETAAVEEVPSDHGNNEETPAQ